MGIVRVPGEVVVAHQLDRGRQRRLVAAKRHADIAPEILGRALGEVLVLGVAAELPMLLHPLQPVRGPAAVRLDMDDFQLGALLEDPEPDQPRHCRHRFERMR